MPLEESPSGATVPHAAPADSKPQHLIFPDELPELIEAPRRPRVSPLTRATQVAGLVGLGALALLGVVSLLPAAGSRLASAGPPESPRASEASPQANTGAAANTVAAAIASYELRERLFANRQMQCPDLARGLVVLEESWTAYSTARPSAAATLDSTSNVSDRSLYARVDQVEQRFERTGCPRP